MRQWGWGAVAACWMAAAALAQTPDLLPAWRGPPIDFSHAGYQGGGVPLPHAPATILVSPGPDDDTDRIMAAVRIVERLPENPDGRRGVVQLDAGEFEIGGQISLTTSGVVLRGAGSDASGTRLLATGQDRRALIRIDTPGRQTPSPGDARQVSASVPLGSRTVPLDSVRGLAVGDAIVVRRPSTAAWISGLGMDAFVGWRPDTRLNWKPGSRDVVWDRRIVAIDGNTVTLDAPLSMAIGTPDSEAFVTAGPSAVRLREAGVEHLRLVSMSDPARPADEDHSWFGIAIDAAEDSWVRDVAAEGFVSSVVDLGAASRRITVQDVSGSDPVSELGGLRRRVFYSAGQQTLFVRCHSRDGIHDFGLGHAAAGPNVFLDCESEDANGDSGTLESWASGALFDGVKVRGDALNLTNRGRDGQGVGWSAANSILWNCEATDVEVRSPPGAPNAAIGCRGELTGDGAVEDPRVQAGRDFFRARPQAPASLYRAQLEARLGSSALAALAPAAAPDVPASTPRLTEADVAAWLAAAHAPAESHPLMLVDGQFLIDGQPALRRRVGFSFFQAQMPPALAPSVGPALTRFAPGLEGVGLTDDLEELADSLVTGDYVEHYYGLWYDRRRVDHDFYGSPNHRTGEAWGPFMELPWARSGEGRAWDGLSKYDLTRFNPWFFDRLRTFADLAERRGVVLYHKLYLQHWLLESRSHYVDFPWRPVNALQVTGMPDEVPAAEAFWDVSDPVRRDLHRLYIRHTLEALRGRSNVIFGLDPEYTGPLPFVQFWLDTIAEWERETGQSVQVALAVPKAVMDAVLDDPARSRTIDAVGFHHWVYRPDGALFAVEGGLDKAPREQVDAIATAADLAGAADPGATRRALWQSTPAMRYRAWREYRDRASGLAIIGAEDGFPDLSRQIEAALPAEYRATLRSDSRFLQPTPTAWGLSAPDGSVMLFSMDGASLALDQVPSAPMTVQWISPTGPVHAVTILEAGESVLSAPPSVAGEPWAVRLQPGHRSPGRAGARASLDAPDQFPRLRAAQLRDAEGFSMNDDRKPTIGDIARLAGVSPMTVSRVINDSARVRPETRAKVETVIAATGYTPDPAARILARAGAGRIGLLYATPSNAYLAEVLAGALSGARAAGLMLMIEPSQAGDPAAERLAVSRLVAGGAQGLIVPPPLGESAATMEAIAQAGLRAVVLAAPDRGPKVVSLRVDDRAAAREMVEHLLALGHRRIGFIEGRGDQSASAERRRGAEMAVAVTPGATLSVAAGDFTYRSGLEAARRLLAQTPRPTAIFASNDDMASGALAAVHGAGLDAPGDVSVAGFDDTYIAASSWPTLTTIRQPAADMAHEAAIRLARPGDAPQPVPHQLILRESTGAPPD